jgi:hypothetical protein
MNLHTINFKGEFQVHDLAASLEFSTTTSAGFNLTRTERLERTNTPAREVVGWLDVHHPCENHPHARLRIALSNESFGLLQTHNERLGVIRDIFTALAIPADESYDALFFTPQGEFKIINDPSALVCCERRATDNIDSPDQPALNPRATKPRYL